MKSIGLAVLVGVGLVATTLAGIVPAQADDVDRAMRHHAMHRMMRHEMHHRTMRHEMHREMRHRMVRHIIRHEMRHGD